ncbi:hypothetical protein EJB05_01185, partial [Eragrostis curvula]
MSMEIASAAANGAEQAAPTSGAANARQPAAGVLRPELFMAARGGEIERLSELLSLNDDEEQAPTFRLLDGVTPIEGDSLLHIVAASGGDGEKPIDCAKMIYNANNDLLAARNNKGDTPLHSAAGAGNGNMISCLVDLATAKAAGDEMEVKEFLRMQNNRGETALHQAVRAGSKTSIDKLMFVDSELACYPREGEEEGTATSALYLAISLGKMDITEHLIHKSSGKLSYSGPGGRNILHAAVSRGQGISLVSTWINFCFGLVVELEGNLHITTVPLLPHLAVQKDKQSGSTPLHLAAALEGWPDACILSRCFPNVWPRPETTLALLLDANPCAAYQPDIQGLYPIHVAALSGSVDAVKTLLEKCPDCATLRDGEGRTFLHVAVEKGRYRVVQYASCLMPQEFSSFLNVQDNNGDTALHRAVHEGDLPVFMSLVQNQHVDVKIPNNDDLTPLDLSWCRIPRLFYYGMNPRCLIHLTLQLVGAPCGGIRPDLISEEHIPNIDNNAVSGHLTNAAQVMGIVSVLVATVTFASAFTLPGGFSNAGTPLLAGTYAFDAFILADTLAFICSCLATFSLIFAGVPAMDINIRLWYFEISAQLLRSSGRSLMVAFALGLYLVLAPVAHATAIAVCAIISITSLYGNSEARQILEIVNAAWARLGTQLSIQWTCILMYYNVFIVVALNFSSFLIIFGLPAIWKQGGAGKLV